MKFLTILSLSILLLGCGNLAKKSPKRAFSERFYRLDSSRVGEAYHQECKKLKEPRECVKTYFNINEKWNTLAPEFIIIPYKYVFP